MARLERIVSVLPEGAMNHNVLRNIMELLAEEVRARGVDYEVLDGSAGDFRRDLLRHAASPGCGIYLGHRFYDMALVHSESGSHERQSLFEALDRPVFATIQDHPFSDFMWPRMQNASRTTHFLCLTPEFESEAQFINPGLTQFHCVTPMVTEALPPAGELKPLAERSIDVLMVCAFYAVRPSVNDLYRKYRGLKSPMASVMEEVMETGLAERERSLLQSFRDSYQRHFGEAFTVSHPMTKADREKLEVLSCIDNRIRFIRRVKTLYSLARLDLPLRIVVTMDPADRHLFTEIADHPRVEVTGRIDAARARDLYLDAKFAVNVMPTYLTVVTERTPNAMGLGCCVISDKNRHFAETFAEGEEILFLDDCEAAGLARYFDEDLDKAQAIATAGREKVERDFAVGHFAEDMIRIMRQVL